MDILFATHNKSKLKSYQKLLEKYDANIFSLNDKGICYDVNEDGNDSVQNAIKKAREYYKISHMITVAEDTSLEFEGVPDSIQPGTHVRRILGEESATDEELLEYYVELVNKYGKNGVLKGKYTKALACCREDGQVVYTTFEIKKDFVNVVSTKRNEGYPLDSMSLIPGKKIYTVDMTLEEKEENKKSDEKKIFDFFDMIFMKNN